MIPKLLLLLLMLTWTLVGCRKFDRYQREFETKEKKPRVLNREYVKNIQYFPYMVALYGDASKSSHANYVCAGILVQPGWVLTVGHCVVRTDGLKLNRDAIDYVVAGVTTLQSLFRQTRKTKHSFLHPLYDTKHKLNDVALVLVEKPFEITAFVDVKSLISKPVLEGRQKCQVLLWTDVQPMLVRNESNMHNTWEEPRSNLLITTVNTIELDECHEFYKYHTKMVTDDNVCSSTVGPGQCKGSDSSGSPLLCEDSLYGIASWSMGCEVQGDFEVWTRVDSHTKWINETITGDLKLDKRMQGDEPTRHSPMDFVPLEDSVFNEANCGNVKISSPVACFIIILVLFE